MFPKSSHHRSDSPGDLDRVAALGVGEAGHLQQNASGRQHALVELPVHPGTPAHVPASTQTKFHCLYHQLLYRHHCLLLTRYIKTVNVNNLAIILKTSLVELPV